MRHLAVRVSEKSKPIYGTVTVKRGFAKMQKGGVIMDVTSVEQAQVAEDAGAVAVMVLDKLPADVRKAGGVARMCDVKIIEEVMDHITIPVMAKCRIGHYMEARVLEAIGVDMIDESEVLTPADEHHHINKWEFKVPFELVKETARLGRLPVVNFAAGGIATPADAALMMHLGCDGIFVGSGIFKSEDPLERAKAIVLATTFWEDPETVAEACRMVAEKKSMPGLDIKSLKPEELMQMRGQ